MTGQKADAQNTVNLGDLSEKPGEVNTFFQIKSVAVDNLAEQIMNIKGFSQLFVISHDDTFERETDNVVRVTKVDGVSQVGGVV